MGIYKVINNIFSDMLKTQGYVFKEVIKSNIHPSVLYRNSNYELQIGYNYEESIPFVCLYGTKDMPPNYNGSDDSLSTKEKLKEYCLFLENWLKSNGTNPKDRLS